MRNIFTDHPHSIGETYFEHMRFALKFGGKMTLGGLACIVHAFLPFAFKKTGSNILLNMVQYFVERMPFVEDRVANISTTIQRRIVQTQGVTTETVEITQTTESAEAN